MSIVEINSSNFIQFQKIIDVVAFSFANPGAQGERGGIKIMTSNGTLYHTNYIQTMNLEDVFTICLPLKECQFSLFDTKVPTGWCSYYIGGGNFLVAQEKFKESILDAVSDGLYDHWVDVIYRHITNL